MTWPLTALRTIGVLAVVAAIVDPGCARPRRPRIDVQFAGDLPQAVREAERRRLADLHTWADVDDSGTPRPAASLTHRILVGDAGPVLAALEERGALAAIRPLSRALGITAIQAPTRVPVGSRVDVTVHVAGVNRDTSEAVQVRLLDASTGAEQARAQADAAGFPGQVRVPWLAASVGRQRLRAEAVLAGSPDVRPAAPVDVSIDVRPASFAVDVLEARPTWIARFVRLALDRGGDGRVSTLVRTAPGTSVRATGAAGGASGAPADVLLVSGVDALTAADVTRLETAVRDAGRALVLLLDEPPAAGAWRRLWPDAPGQVRTAAMPQDVPVAGALWRAREWIALPTSTTAVPLAYVEQTGHPVVVARSLGAGRVVLVSALDAWRWRTDRGVTWEAGWQALLRRLAADVPPPVGLATWVTGDARDRVLQIDATVRPDLDADSVEASVVDGAGTTSLRLDRVQDRRWRGGMRVTSGHGVHRVTVAARAAGGVVTRGEAVIDVRPPAPPGDWSRVTARQRARGAYAVPADDVAMESRGRDDLPATLAEMRTALVTADGPRWHVTRTWWYAGLVLVVLGSEWIVRRALRRR